MQETIEAIVAEVRGRVAGIDEAALAAALARIFAGQPASYLGRPLGIDFGDRNVLSNVTLSHIAGRDLLNISLPQPIDPLPAALAAFASLPIDPLPEPVATLPAASRLPFERIATFVGRAAELRALAQALAANNPAVILPAVATGIGGIGKTSLAIEAAFRFGRYFHGGVFWINCEQSERIASELAACAPALGLNPSQFAPQDLLAQVTIELHKPIPRLLIFDNCEQPAVLREHKPSWGGCRVLVTSRHANWPQATHVAVDTLARAESVALLQALCPRLNATEAALLAADLGDLPLALHLAGSYLNAYRFRPLASYRELLAHKGLVHSSLQGRGIDALPTKHETSLSKTFAMSYERLAPDNPIDALALWLLACLAHCAPGEPVPAPVVAACAPPDTDPDDWADGLARLRNLGLVTGDEPTIHRLIAAFVRAQPQPPGVQREIEDALIAHSRAAARGHDPALRARLYPHLHQSAEHARQRCDIRAAELLTVLGDELHHKGALVAALDCYQAAHTTYAALLPDDDQQLASILNRLTLALQDLGRYEEARAVCERMVRIRQARTTDELQLASSYNTLAYIRHCEGAFAEALPLYQRALAILQSRLPPQHPEIATTINNLAALRQDQGHLSEAQRLFEQALAIRRAILPASHPEIASTINNLAALFKHQGKLDAAQDLFEDALALYKATLPPTHPAIATVLNNLTHLAQAQNRLDQAQVYVEQTLIIRQSALPPTHPDLAASLHDLAQILRYQGRLNEALPLYQRALAIREQALPATHPELARTCQHLATLLRDLGRPRAAIPLLERAHWIANHNHGAAHSVTQAIARQLQQLRTELDTSL